MNTSNRGVYESASGSDSRRPRGRGFTVNELLVVLALIAVIMGLAVPSFARMASAAAITSGVNQFLADVRFARSEAIRRGGGVVLCLSENPESDLATCAPSPGAPGWATGWIVFHDRNGDGNRTTGEDLLRVHGRSAGIESIATDGTPTQLRFSAIGRLVVPGPITSLHFGAPALEADIRRVVCVGPGGRARIAGDGAASCGGGD
jgi:type IV fimbrial biogenesis protein FimT